MSENIELQTPRENARLVMPDSQDSKTIRPIIGYAQEPLLPLVDACKPLVSIIFNILVYVSIALENTPDNPSDGLTSDESASIHLYTMEWNDGHRSLYSILNETLRKADREQLKPWFKYLKLLLTGACLYPKKTKRRWYNKKQFIIPVSILTAMLILAVVLGSTLGSKSTHNTSGMRFDFLFNSMTTDG
ncbi:unnamed protein product [Rotaria sordida]|uniref:Uncharacterized protein n=1 Tax=Rotaria sordida TaxID=392033 RepID=A0A815KHP8_9BILA|nr:unnamed protein product [Rotaria sordida]CAF1457113.1 unnamed protein product [Rotaria sordida]